MKKSYLLLILSLSGLTLSAIAQEEYKCRFNHADLKTLYHIVTLNEGKITTTLGDDFDGSIFVENAPCDLIPTGNLKMSLQCYDEEDKTLSFTLNTSNLTLETSYPWGEPTSMSCIKN